MAKTLPDTTHVTVADPDNFMGSPAFDGPIHTAHVRLPVGIYAATTEDGTPIELAVGERLATARTA